MSKEMLGGCCVCSDERGWTENPLVYCDGPGCNVAVHQACYGIVSVPIGPWFCRKCESKDRVGRVKCELCPAKDGALKRTDNNKWAHVVCALYIPEVRFGNVTTMEPIIILSTPPERFNRTCYICLEQNAKSSKATAGACMQCNKPGCKQQFHVTCGQALGLLCEEAGNYLDNVKYCGYCQHHYSKLKKGGNVKTIPAYKPVATGEHDSSPEKDPEGNRNAGGSKKGFIIGKGGSSFTAAQSVPTKSTSPDVVFPLKTEDDKDNATDDGSGENSGGGLKFGTTTSHVNASNAETTSTSSASNTFADAAKSKFTTSNFIETVITQSEPIFGPDKISTVPPTANSPDGGGGKLTKKRKTSSAGMQDGESGTTSPIVTLATTTTTTTATTSSSPNTQITMKSLSVSLPNIKGVVLAGGARTINVAGLSKASTPNPMSVASKSNLTVHGSGTKITITAQRDDGSKKVTPEQQISVASVDIKPVGDNGEFNASSSDFLPGKRSRSNSSDKVRKPKKTPNKRVQGVTNPVKDEPESPPESPDDKRGRKRVVLPVKQEEPKEAKNVSVLNAPHMLGNQLNPASSMAQKMNDSLSQELEAHSIYSQDTVSDLGGPSLPRRFRGTNNDKTATLSAANSLLSLGNSPAGSSSSNSAQTAPISAGEASMNAHYEGLEQLLERQWQQGSNFLMDQAQHFDISSLLTLIYKLKKENTDLEDTLKTLSQRRDHLLAVNARLSIPLSNHNLQPLLDLPSINNNAAAAPVRMENGHRDDNASYTPMHARNPNQPLLSVRPAPTTVYNNQQIRRPVVSNYQNYPPSQMSTQSMNVRRDDHQQM